MQKVLMILAVSLFIFIAGVEIRYSERTTMSKFLMFLAVLLFTFIVGVVVFLFTAPIAYLWLAKIFVSIILITIVLMIVCLIAYF